MPFLHYYMITIITQHIPVKYKSYSPNIYSIRRVTNKCYCDLSCNMNTIVIKDVQGFSP